MPLGKFYFFLCAGVWCFILGVCVTGAIAETFWPQVGDALWVRAAGGIAGLGAFGFSVRLMPQWFIRRASLWGLVCVAMLAFGRIVHWAFGR